MGSKGNKNWKVSRRKAKRIGSRIVGPVEDRMVNKRHGKRIRNQSRNDKKISDNLRSDERESEFRKDGVSGISDNVPEKESEINFHESLDRFLSRVAEMLSRDAISKGYANESGGRRLYDFINDYAGEGHALGEIIYKATRYRRKRDPIDMVKSAAWSFLIWDKNQRG